MQWQPYRSCISANQVRLSVGMQCLRVPGPLPHHSHTLPHFLKAHLVHLCKQVAVKTLWLRLAEHCYTCVQAKYAASGLMARADRQANKEVLARLTLRFLLQAGTWLGK